MENQPVLYGKYPASDVFALRINWDLEDEDLHGFDTAMFADFKKHGKKLRSDDIVAAKLVVERKPHYSIHRVADAKGSFEFKAITGAEMTAQMEIIGICIGYSATIETIRARSRLAAEKLREIEARNRT